MGDSHGDGTLLILKASQCEESEVPCCPHGVA